MTTSLASAATPFTPPGNHPRAMRDDSMGFLLECSRHSSITLLNLDRPTLLVNEPDDIRHVLAKNYLNYPKAGFVVDFEAIFAKSLISLGSEEHRCARKAFASEFQMRSLEGAPNRAAAHAKAAVAEWEKSDRIDIAVESLSLLSAIAGESILGISPHQSHQIDEFFSLIHKVHGATVDRLRMPIHVPRWVPIKSHRRERRFQIAFRERMLQLIEERRQSGQLGDDFVSLMLTWQRERPNEISDQWIADHAPLLFLAGYEATGNIVAWSLVLLSLHNDVEQHLLDELDSALDGRTPTLAELMKLQYLRMVIEETERLKPSPWLLKRRAMGSDRLPSGCDVPAGTEIFISPYTLHRREDLYPDPERFDPERFAPQVQRPRASYTFLPFGGGPRVCIGEHLGQVTAMTVVATILPKIRIEVEPPLPEQESLNDFTAQPTSGKIPVRVFRR